MSYKTCHRYMSSSKKSAAGLQIQHKINSLLSCYKALSKQNRAGADLIWGSIVPPFFVPVSKGGHLRVLETAIIGEKNPAHVYTKIVSKVSVQ